MLCETCDKREYCSDLCPEAEAYVNMDNVNQRHLIPTKPIELSTEDWYNQNTVWDYSKYRYTPKELKHFIISLHGEGKSYREIQYHLGCDIAYISRVLTKFRTNSI